MEHHPKHHFQYCPRCSTKGQFNSKRYSFKCPECGFEFFLNASAAVTAIIFNKEGQLLMTRRGVEPEIGKLDLPGGFIDPEESAEEALKREVREELNLVPTSVAYFGSFPNEYLYSGTIVHTVDLAFKCQVKDFSGLAHADDVSGFEFVPLMEIPIDELPFQSLKNIIKQLQYEHHHSK
ncbi:MAG: NUDIX domain-containing protein [Prolixibacteraceae bacterium]|nr:NUDIX domain-containing protein [Prolixibacteraceae bacterium]